MIERFSKGSSPIEQFDEGDDIQSSKVERLNPNVKRTKKFFTTRIYLRIFYSLSLITIIFLLIFIAFFKDKKSPPSLPTSETFPVLAADIGGTNCRLRLLRISADISKNQTEIKSDVLKPWEFSGVEELLKKFLEPFENTDNYPIYAALGVPGAIVDNTMMSAVNIPNWKMTKGSDIAQSLGIRKVVFLNDFVCNGYGIQSNLKEGVDFININNKPIKEDEKKFIIGPGTGLGVCYLIKNEGDEYHTIYGSEGSHGDFAPKNDMSLAYLKFLQKFYSIENISMEKACAGPALVPMYQFIKGYENIKRDEELGKQIDELNVNSDKDLVNKINKQIIEYAVKGKCPLCKRVMEYFIELLGNISGNLSMYTLPFGGVYLVGGITKTLEPILKQMDPSIFLKYFMSRGEQNNLLEDIPIILVKNLDLGMRGAIEYTRRLILGVD